MLAKDVFAYFDPGRTPPRKSKTARALGVTPGLLTKWEKAGKVPEIWARRLADRQFCESRGIRKRFKFQRELYADSSRDCEAA